MELTGEILREWMHTALLLSSEKEVMPEKVISSYAMQRGFRGLVTERY